MKAFPTLLNCASEPTDGAIRDRDDRRNVHEEAVIAAALLVNTAFRMRDEAALVMALRRLAGAIAVLEGECEEEPAAA